jgi:hypothetical protein
MNIDSTLTRSEREAPFREAEPDPEPLTGPTRTALEIIEEPAGFWFVDRHPRTFEKIEASIRAKQSKGDH